MVGQEVSRATVPHRRFEAPSLALAAGVYGGFFGLTFFHAHLPAFVFAATCAVLTALHASMQHEFIHGHPTPWRPFNRALGFVPLSLWLPFETYRITHLVHHRDEHLTDPFDDPESYYWTAEGWAKLGRLGRLFLRVHSTLAGRLALGPAWTIARFLLLQGRALMAGDVVARRIWRWHALGVAVVATWIVGVCGIGLPFYLAFVVYPATSILLLRSFAEHRAESDAFERTAIVENAPVLGFLFLYNNLHAAHHERPLIPWYKLPHWYRLNRERLLSANGGLVYDGYADVVRRYLFTPHDDCLHPAHAAAPAHGAMPAYAGGVLSELDAAAVARPPERLPPPPGFVRRRSAGSTLAYFAESAAKRVGVRA